MSLLPLPFEDVALTNMVTIANAYSAAQSVFNAAVAFKAERDRMAPPSDEELSASPLVNFVFDSSVPKGGGKQVEAGTATFYADLYVARYEAEDDTVPVADKAALARLYYFKAQVKAALFDLASYNLGFDPPAVTVKRWGRFQVFPPPQQPGEAWVVGGRWTFEFDYEWAPDSPEGVALDSIKVDTGLWAGLYTF